MLALCLALTMFFYAQFSAALLFCTVMLPKADLFAIIMPEESLFACLSLISFLSKFDGLTMLANHCLRTFLAIVVEYFFDDLRDSEKSLSLHYHCLLAWFLRASAYEVRLESTLPKEYCTISAVVNIRCSFFFIFEFNKQINCKYRFEIFNYINTLQKWRKTQGIVC